MTVAAAVDIVADDQEALIAAAATYAQQRGEACFMISIVGNINDSDREIVERNLELMTARNASPVLLRNGSDRARTLAAAAEKFGIAMLFVQNGRRHWGRRSLAEQIVHLHPAFEVVVVHKRVGPK